MAQARECRPPSRALPRGCSLLTCRPAASRCCCCCCCCPLPGRRSPLRAPWGRAWSSRPRPGARPPRAVPSGLRHPARLAAVRAASAGPLAAPPAPCGPPPAAPQLRPRSSSLGMGSASCLPACLPACRLGPGSGPTRPLPPSPLNPARGVAGEPRLTGSGRGVAARAATQGLTDTPPPAPSGEAPKSRPTGRDAPSAAEGAELHLSSRGGTPMASRGVAHADSAPSALAPPSPSGVLAARQRPL